MATKAMLRLIESPEWAQWAFYVIATYLVCLAGFSGFLQIQFLAISFRMIASEVMASCIFEACFIVSGVVGAAIALDELAGIAWCGLVTFACCVVAMCALVLLMAREEPATEDAISCSITENELSEEDHL